MPSSVRCLHHLPSAVCNTWLLASTVWYLPRTFKSLLLICGDWVWVCWYLGLSLPAVKQCQQGPAAAVATRPAGPDPLQRNLSPISVQFHLQIRFCLLQPQNNVTLVSFLHSGHRKFCGFSFGFFFTSSDLWWWIQITFGELVWLISVLLHTYIVPIKGSANLGLRAEALFHSELYWRLHLSDMLVFDSVLPINSYSPFNVPVGMAINEALKTNPTKPNGF